MITAVDTNVLIDFLGGDPEFGPRSRTAVGRCLAEGVLIASDVVWAEVMAAFASADDVASTLRDLRVDFSEIGAPAATRAGQAWRAYRERGGSRERIIADFLVGAHALIQADRLLTRDRGFHRSSFDGLTIIDPTT